MDINEVWKHAQRYISESVNSAVAYNTYLKDAFAVSFENSIFTIAVSLPTRKKMIEIKYKRVIEAAISRVAAVPVSLKVIIAKSPADTAAAPAVIIKREEEHSTEVKKEEEQDSLDTSSNSEPPVNQKTNLNPRYTLENFVVGNSNSYAFAAAENIIKYPAQNNNPFFLYGKSGLGKTHLMQAIGNEILKRNPNMQVLYVTSEKFTNDMVHFLKEKNMQEFRRHYREIDVLLVDDVQFIEGKDGTQEEFFHTFNDLYMKNKQIVLTSDRKPKDLITLEERLRNRFEWGLAIDVVLPDYETRVAILRKKAESLNIDISNEIFDYIAQRVNSNIRELEGALSKIIAYSGISHRQIDIDLAEYALSSLIPNEVRITPQRIIESVCDFYNLKAEDIKGHSRVKELVTPRHIAMYLCKNMTDMNFAAIAQVFGNRDRTTVIHGVDKIMKNMQSSPELRSEIEFITKDLDE